MTDSRLQQLNDWVGQTLTGIEPGCKPQLSMVSGDASFRRYFRVVWSGSSVIAVDAPPEHENNQRFLRVNELFHAGGARVPEVLAADLEQGFLLLTDFGDDLYLDVLLAARQRQDQDRIDELYGQAVKAMVDFQARVDKEVLDPYDRVELHSEMALFEEWFCIALLKLELSKDEQTLIARTLHLLEDAALAQPLVPVHRDYHSRNLMLLDANRFGADVGPGIIDFQDAVRGPYSYDLVSLLRDCYIVWPEQQVRAWALDYLALARQRGVVPELDERQFFRDFDVMGLQRHLKVMGIFSRLCLRDNKSRYLADIPLVMDYFLKVASRHPDLAEFLDWFRLRVEPVAHAVLSAAELARD